MAMAMLLSIIAVPVNDPAYSSYTDISQLPNHISEEMNHFFRVYKQLEEKETVVHETGDRAKAVKVVEEAIESYVEHFCK